MKTIREILQTFAPVLLGALLLLITLGALSAHGATATLTWDHSISPDIKGYRVYWSTLGTQQSVTNVVPTGYTNKVAIVVPDAQTMFYCTALATNSVEPIELESDPSNVIIWTPLSKPKPPGNFTLIITGIYR